MKIFNLKKGSQVVNVRLNSFEVDILHSCVQDVLKKQVINSDNSNVSILFDLLSTLKECQKNMDLPF